MNEKPVDPIFQTFFDNANIGTSDQKKLLKRLPISISFLQTLGIGLDDVPTEEHMKQLEAHLRTLKQEKGRYKGKGYEDTTITDWVNRTKDFYSVRNGNSSNDSVQLVIAEAESIEATPAPTGGENNTLKGEHHMTDTQTMTADNSAVTAEHKIVQQEAQPQAPSTVEASRKPGRPETTGRSEKFTLYMTPELWKKITMLADLDEVKITDLMNEALEYYCENERSEDIAFLYTLERRKQERRLQKARS